MPNPTQLTTPYLPRREKEEIRTESDQLRTALGRTAIPVDVDSIVEDLGISAIELPGLQDRIGQDACLDPGFRYIYYDVDLGNEGRLRFSLAHEVGHVVLHRGVLEKLPPPETVDAWMAMLRGLPAGWQNSLEWQAQYFASTLLMPHADLLTTFDGLMGHMLPQIQEVQTAGMRRDQYLDFVATRVAETMARRYEVTALAVLTRMKVDGLVEEIP